MVSLGRFFGHYEVSHRVERPYLPNEMNDLISQILLEPRYNFVLMLIPADLFIRCNRKK